MAPSLGVRFSQVQDLCFTFCSCLSLSFFLGVEYEQQGWEQWCRTGGSIGFPVVGESAEKERER